MKTSPFTWVPIGRAAEVVVHAWFSAPTSLQTMHEQRTTTAHRLGADAVGSGCGRVNRCKGWGPAAIQMCLDRPSQPIQDGNASPPGRPYDGEDPFHEPATRVTVGSKGGFLPNHGPADSGLGAVVRRVDDVHKDLQCHVSGEIRLHPTCALPPPQESSWTRRETS